jgi:antibiotic biosynthesis monooxygenase (ABM) superfamily enzyme
MRDENHRNTNKAAFLQPVFREEHSVLLEKKPKNSPIRAWVSWITMSLAGLLSLFFLVFGIEVLLGAYALNNPLEFIVLFFSASFVILLSGVGLVFTFFNIHRFLKRREKGVKKT